MSQKPKRINKSKQDLIQETKIKQDSDRKRSIVREKIFPLLLSLGGDIRYLKIFLFTASTAVDQVMDSKKSETKISEIKDEMIKLFKGGDDISNEKVNHYAEIFEMLQDETINSFQSMIRDLPDNIDRFFYKQMEKKAVDQINIDEVLG